MYPNFIAYCALICSNSVTDYNCYDGKQKHLCSNRFDFHSPKSKNLVALIYARHSYVVSFQMLHPLELNFNACTNVENFSTVNKISQNFNETFHQVTIADV